MQHSDVHWCAENLQNLKVCWMIFINNKKKSKVSIQKLDSSVYIAAICYYGPILAIPAYEQLLSEKCELVRIHTGGQTDVHRTIDST